VSGKVARDSAELRKHAKDLTKVANKVDALRTEIDAAMRPVRSENIPESGEINGIYSPLSRRISLAAANLRIEARRLVVLADLQDYVEMLGLKKLDKALLKAQAGDPDAVFKWLTAGNALTVADGTYEGLNYVLPSVDDALKSGSALQAVSRGSLHGVGNILAILSLVLNVKTIMDPKSEVNDELAAYTGIGITAAGLLGASGAGPAGLTFGVTYTYADYTNDMFMRNDSLKKSLAEIYQPGRRGGIPRQLVDTGLLGVHAISKDIAKDFYPDTPQPDEISTEQAAIIAARVKLDFPGARVVPGDGSYMIMFPTNDAYMSGQYVVHVDNKTGRVISGPAEHHTTVLGQTVKANR